MSGVSIIVAVLIVRARGRICALRMGDVIETMRPLPVEPMSSMPAFVLGLSVIRGTPTPVVDLGRAIGSGEETPTGRFVTVRCGARTVALAVDSVQGAHAFDPSALEDLPPLLQDMRSDAVDALGVLDHQLFVVLRTARLLTEEVWRAMEKAIATVSAPMAVAGSPSADVHESGAL